MRILVACDQWFPDHRGGVARVAKETARELVERGHTVTVLVPARPGLPITEVIDGLVVIRGLRRRGLPQTAADVFSARHLAQRLQGQHDLLVAHQVTTACGLAAARAQASPRPRVPQLVSPRGTT